VLPVKDARAEDTSLGGGRPAEEGRPAPKPVRRRKKPRRHGDVGDIRARRDDR
jgi:hypothetical protein